MMYQRIDPRAVLKLYRQDLPGPVDVLNLIDFADRDQYRWYGMFVSPTIYGVGGGMLWAGRWEKSLLGERQAEELMVVRYPSHRRFLAMTMSPYYALINPFRERGVARFEASFTHATQCDDNLQRYKRLLVVHYQGAPETKAALQSLLGVFGAEPVYASSESSAIDCFHRREPSDPNPLTYKSVLFCSLPDDSLEPGREVIEALARATQGLSLQIYARESLASLMPEAAAPLLRLIKSRKS